VLARSQPLGEAQLKRIGFIGVGTMGAPMARNLLKGGLEVRAFDVDPTALGRIAGEGATAGGSAADAARDAEFVIIMLPNGEHVEAALFGADGIADAMRRDALYIDMSTIAPVITDRLAHLMAERGIEMIDAPVGRQVQHAIEGKLLIMAGGSEAVVARAMPVFEKLGDTIVHCGPAGAGSRMKVVNNFMSITLNVTTAEALTLAEASGLDVELARKVMLGTVAGQGHMGTTYPAKVLKGDLGAGFMIDLAHKDLGLALDLAAGLGVAAATGEAARKAYARARAQGRGRQDWTAIYAMARNERRG
jgi:4-hydroxybutyrate dehydrogenase/sulfolactaldehyde 3-reductase